MNQRLALLTDECGLDDHEVDMPESLRRSYVLEALKWYRNAFDAASAPRNTQKKSAAWRQALHKEHAVLVDHLLTWVRESSSDREDRAETVHAFAREATAEHKCRLLLEAASIQFHLSLDDDLDPVDCASALEDTLQRIRECEHYFNAALPRDDDEHKEILRETIDDLLDSVTHHGYINSSALWRSRGDITLDQALDELDGGKLIDLAWVAADMYRQSLVEAFERDIESEAQSCSRLGHVFDKCLAMHDKSKMYYHRTLDLAFSLSPRTFTHETWFKQAQQRLRQYQEEALLREESSIDAERKLYETELAPIFNALKNESSSTEGFIRFVYLTHPPKTHTMTLDMTLIPDHLKKAYRKALEHYHPDKQAKGKEREQRVWFYVAEEISKLLSQKYTLMQGIDND